MCSKCVLLQICHWTRSSQWENSEGIRSEHDCHGCIDAGWFDLQNKNWYKAAETICQSSKVNNSVMLQIVGDSFADIEQVQSNSSKAQVPDGEVQQGFEDKIIVEMIKCIIIDR